MTAMRLSHDNNNESKSTIRRSNPAEINASQPPTSQRSFNSLNNIAVSQDRVKPIPSNAGLSVQVSIF